MDLSPGTAMNENTVSPGWANGGCSTVAVIVPVFSASVPVKELLNSIWKNVFPAHVILAISLICVLAGNDPPPLIPVIAVPIVAVVDSTLAVVK